MAHYQGISSFLFSFDVQRSVLHMLCSAPPVEVKYAFCDHL
jgi:hypothetical protein